MRRCWVGSNRPRAKAIAACCCRRARGEASMPSRPCALPARHRGVIARANRPWPRAGPPAERLVDLGKLSERTVLYTGTAGEAALLYPQNANVAAAVALAGLGFDATEVELVADPDAPGNIHEIEAEGAAGRFAIQLQG